MSMGAGSVLGDLPGCVPLSLSLYPSRRYTERETVTSIISPTSPLKTDTSPSANRAMSYCMHEWDCTHARCVLNSQVIRATCRGGF